MTFRLSDILGGSESFWVNRYLEFQEYVVASNIKVLSSNNLFLNSLSEIRSTNIHSLSDDFKVSTLEHLIADYFDMPQIMYSRNQKHEPSLAKLANWIRKCELIAETKIISQSIPFFDAEELREIIPDLISLGRINNVIKAVPKIKELVASVGVILVLSPSEKGYGVSGFTKKLLKNYRIVVVTDRYKNNAAFWFTLLHELAHCILHSINQPLIHYSDNEFILANSSTMKTYEEEEANTFVESMLFPDDFRVKLIRASKSYKLLIQLAVEYEIPTSLVAAQVHRAKLAPYSHFRKVFQPFKFEEIF